MTKFIVKQEKTGNTTAFRLVDNDGDIYLKAFDPNRGGSSTTVLVIKTNGKLQRFTSVNPTLGLYLDGNNRIIEEEEF